MKNKKPNRAYPPLTTQMDEDLKKKVDIYRITKGIKFYEALEVLVELGFKVDEKQNKK